MKQIFDIFMEKYFALLAGTIVLAIIVVGMQIAVNFGSLISQSTIAMGWMLVAIWTVFITMLCIVHLNKNSENNE